MFFPFNLFPPFHGSFFYLVNRFLSFSPAVSFIASSFSSSFVSIRRIHLAGSLTIRVPGIRRFFYRIENEITGYVVVALLLPLSLSVTVNENTVDDPW